MNHLVYQYSLCAALSLMTFFSLYFLLTRTPEKPIFKDYFRSRRIMGNGIAGFVGQLCGSSVLWYPFCQS